MTSSLNFRLFAIQCIVSVVRSVLTNIDGLDRLHSLQARLKALFKDCHVNIKLSMKCWEMTFLGSKGRFPYSFSSITLNNVQALNLRYVTTEP